MPTQRKPLRFREAVFFCVLMQLHPLALPLGELSPQVTERVLAFIGRHFPASPQSRLTLSGWLISFDLIYFALSVGFAASSPKGRAKYRT